MTGENYVRAAYSYLFLGDFDSAIDAFARAIHADPENASHYFRGSLTALRSGRSALALKWAIRASHLAPDDSLYKQHVGAIHSIRLTDKAKKALAHSQRDFARSLLEKAVRWDPLNQDASQMLEDIQTYDSGDSLSESGFFETTDLGQECDDDCDQASP